MLYVKEEILHLLPRSREKQLVEFYSVVIDPVKDIQRHLYQLVAHKIIDWENLANTIGNTKWDLHEIGVEHSAYVDLLVHECELFNKQLLLEANNSGAIPRHVRSILWGELSHFCSETLVEGYSRARKCTMEGRAVMSLDLRIVQSSLEKICPVKPLPGIAYADTYIKAYYLKEDDFIQWCKEHSEYGLQQWVAIVNQSFGPQMLKKNRQNMQVILEELDRRRSQR